MIVSDFLFFPGQRDRGPTMSFIRCDRGMTPADHHTVAIALGPSDRYVHSAYQVCDLDALAAGGEYLKDHGYHRSWGIGRHIQGSQLFDYWRDPDGFLVEHFADGDMFDCTLEPGWAPFTASGLAVGTACHQGLPRHQPQIPSTRGAIGANRASRRQRIRHHPPHQPAESDLTMTIAILHTVDAWWVQTPTGAAKIATSATTTAELLADRAAIEVAAHGSDTVPVDSLDLVSPVTKPCRVVAQMTNFASHVNDAGMDPKTISLTFFRKSSASITGPFDDIVKPGHVRFLDYEVEIGLIIGPANGNIQATELELPAGNGAATALTPLTIHQQSHLTGLPAGPARNVAALYASLAEDLANHTHTVPDFAHALTIHRLLADIEVTALATSVIGRRPRLLRPLPTVQGVSSRARVRVACRRTRRRHGQPRLRRASPSAR
jgi:hypothetical protein